MADYDRILADAARRWPDKAALLAGAAVHTYAEVAATVDAVAAALAARGVRAGDRVALCLGNDPEWVFAFFALSRLRASAVMMSTAWMAHEIGHAFAVTGPTAVIADAAKAPLIDEAGRPALAILAGADADGRPGWHPFAELTAGGSPAPPRDPADPSGSELALPFSSGTTGLPKAVRHTHRSLTVATIQWRDALGVTDGDRLQALTPLSHILGIVNVGATFAAGATIRLFRKFSPRTMIESFEADRITIGMTVAPIAAALAAMGDLERFRLDSLRYLNWSATPVNQDIAREVTRRTGIGWVPAYGTTEVPILAVNPVDRLPRTRLDSVGLPPPGVEIEAVDPATGAFLPRGATGELVARSPAAMSGYLPAGGPSPFLDGGWYRTGDIGHVEPEGWVVVTDRLKDLIRVSGHQVSPVEVETVLAASPLVADCAVFGAPDDRRGEVACAAVVPAAGWEPDADAIRAWLAERLAPYKLPRDVHFVARIPRTASGKVQRRLLRP